MPAHALLALLLSIAAAATRAEEPASALDAPEFEPLTVTATRTLRRADEVSASVGVVNAGEIEARGASTVAQAVRDLPGVAVEGGPRRDAEFINIRGLSGPRVMFIVDGARQNFYSGHRSNLLLEPELIKRIEVLRGPGSALWGSDAVGGVVAVTTRDAADFLHHGETFGARLRTGYDSVSSGKLMSSLGAMRLGAFDAIADVSWRNAGNYRLGRGQDQPDSAARSLGSLVRLSWQPDGPHHAGLDYQGFRDHGISPSNPAHDVAGDNPLLDRRNDQRYVGVRYGFLPDGDGWLQSVAANIYRSDLEIREDRVESPRRDRTAFLTVGTNAQASIGLPRDALVTLGGEAYEDLADAQRNGAPRPQFPDARRHVVGGFAQVEFPLGPLSLVPGARYDRYAAQSSDDVARSVEASAVSPKLGVVWRVNGADGLKLRLARADGFRAPSLVELYSSGQHFLGNNFTPNPALRPERARSVEAGASWNAMAFGGRANFDGSVYRNRIRDFIELSVAADVQMAASQCAAVSPAVGCVNRNDDGSANPRAPPIFVGGTTTSRNLTDATLTGGELQAAWEIGPMKLGVGYSRVRGIDTGNGQPLASIPADTIRSNLDWTLPRDLRATLGFVHARAQDRVPATTAGTVTISPSTPLDALILSRFSVSGPEPMQPTPAYSVWNAALSWTPFAGGWGMREPRITLGVDNLADASYREHLNTLANPGRNVRLSLSSSF